MQQIRVYRQAEVTEHDAHEKNPGHTEGDSADLASAQNLSQGYYDRQYYHYMRDAPAPGAFNAFKKTV